jgi:hypothetical protein
MELPNDIWDIIVKKSLKSNEEIIKEKTYHELRHLMSDIKFRQYQIIRDIKKKINKYDILDIYYDKVYHFSGIVMDKLDSNNENIKIRRFIKDANEKTIMDDCIACFRTCNLNIISCEFKIISTEEERKNKNIELSNTLKSGDSICYSSVSVPQYLRYYNYHGDRLLELNREGVVAFTTKNKVCVNNIGYIDKSRILKIY